jgi:hypothetical protein
VGGYRKKCDQQWALYYTLSCGLGNELLRTGIPKRLSALIDGKPRVVTGWTAAVFVLEGKNSNKRCINGFENGCKV